ncbi:MAG: hypothetical protein MZV63_30340, partial [Marinilabiliales bacterium]|nr:hypothetical protein [Marinilabiliales bacterium]
KLRIAKVKQTTTNGIDSTSVKYSQPAGAAGGKRATSRIPFLVAIPKSVMNPIIAGMLRIPEVKYIANTPPIKARGRLSRIIPASLKFLNSRNLIIKR